MSIIDKRLKKVFENKACAVGVLEKAMASVRELPDELLLVVFSHLGTARELCTVSETCKRWYAPGHGRVCTS